MPSTGELAQPLRVAFINENTLGHVSYLPPFVRMLRERRELGIDPRLIDAVPLPPELHVRANRSVRGLRRWGLDFGAARWRLIASGHARAQLEALHAREPFDAVVVNTQSVGLDLLDLTERLPTFVCLDATFRQLADSRWLAPNAPSRWVQPLTLAPILGRERRLLQRAHRLLAWSEPVRRSLIGQYHLPFDRIELLPPSLALPAPRQRQPSHGRSKLLFMGSDFRRKGGPLLLECYRRQLAGQCELHIVTQSEDVAPEPGVFVHRNVTAHSAEWRERWESADVFVFPSALETFGIVLLEALAFEVPVVSSRAGAASDLLDFGRAGVLLDELTESSLAAAIHAVLADPAAARARAEVGRARAEEHYDLTRNTERLARLLHEAVPGSTAAR